MQKTKCEVRRGGRRDPDAREDVDAVLPPALAGEPLCTHERCASLLPKHGDVGTPDSRQRNDGRSAFHVSCIEPTPSTRDPSTD